MALEPPPTQAQHGVRQATGQVEHLLAGLVADDPLERPDQLGNGCGPATVPSR